MAQRAFKYFTIHTTSTPQPLVGTYLTASSVLPGPTLGTIQNSDTFVTLTVADSSMFQPKDPFVIQTPTGTNMEQGQVQTIVSGTSIQVKGLLLAHTGGAFGTGEFVSLASTMNSVHVQSLDGNTGDLYIGIGPAFVVSTGVGMIAKMVFVAAGTQPIEFDSTRGGLANVDSLGQLFITGTAADSYLPSFGII
jgi:hypothetical protein